jgi:hypothetical protein
MKVVISLCTALFAVACQRSTASPIEGVSGTGIGRAKLAVKGGRHDVP